MTNLTEKAMTARLSVSQWTARKLDKGATAQVIEDNRAKAGAGNFNKALIARDALKAVSQAVDTARGFHTTNTLPWTDDGNRLLPSANYFAYSDRMRELRADFDAAVATFCEGYPTFIDAARVQLGKLFCEADYPHVSAIRRKFSWDVVHQAIADSSDFRVDIGAEEQDRIRRDIEARNATLIESAMADAWNRVHDVVSHMAERLRLYQCADGRTHNPFRDSLVQNVRDLADLLPRLNVTDNPQLSEIAGQLRETLCQHEPQELRDSRGLRESVVSEAESILGMMAAYTGIDPAQHKQAA